MTETVIEIDFIYIVIYCIEGVHSDSPAVDMWGDSFSAYSAGQSTC